MADIEFKKGNDIFCHYCLSNIDRSGPDWMMSVYQWTDHRIPDPTHCLMLNQTYQAFDTLEPRYLVAFVPAHTACARKSKEEKQEKAFERCGPKEEKTAVKDTLARRQELADRLWFYGDMLSSASSYRTRAKQTSPVDSFSYILEARTWHEINKAPVIHYIEKNAGMRSMVMGVLKFEKKLLASLMHTMKTNPKPASFSWWIMSETSLEISSDEVKGNYFYLVILYIDKEPDESSFPFNIETLLTNHSEKNAENVVKEYLDMFQPIYSTYQANLGADGAVFNSKRSKPGFFSAAVTVNSNSLGLVFCTSNGRIIQPRMFQTSGIVPTFFDIADTKGQMVKQTLDVEKDIFDVTLASRVIYQP